MAPPTPPAEEPVPPRPPGPLAARVPAYAWPTLLSLDAPVVALAWQELFARGAAAQPLPAERAVLALSVWLVYAADRLADGRRYRPDAPATLRLEAAARWRRPLALAWAAVLALDLGLALAVLPPTSLARGTVVLAAALGYFLTTHRPPRRDRAGPPRELLIGALFAAGTTFALWGAGAVLLVPALLFAVLCALNPALIGLWEADLDAAQGLEPAPARLPGLARWAGPAAWALAATAAAAVLLGAPAPSAAVVPAALGLGALHAARRPIPLEARRVLADAVLLLGLATLAPGA